MKRSHLLLLATLLTLNSCTTDKARRHIGVSQCSEDIWRDWQNAEMKLEASFHDDVKLSFTTAHDDSRRQIQQIDSLVASGIDLLIVAPNQMQNISSAIDRAYDSGIPVIVFERKTDSRKYTAFVSADNYEMGRQMGEYLAMCLGGKGSIMEVMGLRGSSPADERHRGFNDAIARYPEMQVTATLQGDWTEETAYTATKQWLKGSSINDKCIDVVFGHNDRTAMGARRAYVEWLDGMKNEELKNNLHSSFKNTLPLFCGIDGLPGENGGIRQVRDSLLTASYIYPTRGDLLLQLALDILDGKPFEREILLTSALVTHENANVLYLESEEVVRRSMRLERMHQVASGYLRQLSAQRTITVLALGVIALLLIAIGLFYLYHRSQANIRRERVLNNLWNLTPSSPKQPVQEQDVLQEHTQEQDVLQEHTPSPSLGREAQTGIGQAAKNSPLQGGDGGGLLDKPLDSAPTDSSAHPFIARFREVVERNMSNSELSVEDLAADMNLSRVQLYRKVKGITGSSPVELLRTARLNRAHQLLLTTDKTVSEVAYAVGFSAPAYFSKCFKEEFGMVPGEARR